MEIKNFFDDDCAFNFSEMIAQFDSQPKWTPINRASSLGGQMD
jgi:hypothetical protein